MSFGVILSRWDLADFLLSSSLILGLVRLPLAWWLQIPQSGLLSTGDAGACDECKLESLSTKGGVIYTWIWLRPIFAPVSQKLGRIVVFFAAYNVIAFKKIKLKLCNIL